MTQRLDVARIQRQPRDRKTNYAQQYLADRKEMFKLAWEQAKQEAKQQADHDKALMDAYQRQRELLTKQIQENRNHLARLDRERLSAQDKAAEVSFLQKNQNERLRVTEAGKGLRQQQELQERRVRDDAEHARRQDLQAQRDDAAMDRLLTTEAGRDFRQAVGSGGAAGATGKPLPTNVAIQRAQRTTRGVPLNQQLATQIQTYDATATADPNIQKDDASRARDLSVLAQEFSREVINAGGTPEQAEEFIRLQLSPADEVLLFPEVPTREGTGRGTAVPDGPHQRATYGPPPSIALQPEPLGAAIPSAPQVSGDLTADRGDLERKRIIQAGQAVQALLDDLEAPTLSGPRDLISDAQRITRDRFSGGPRTPREKAMPITVDPRSDIAKLLKDAGHDLSSMSDQDRSREIQEILANSRAAELMQAPTLKDKDRRTAEDVIKNKDFLGWFRKGGWRLDKASSRPSLMKLAGNDPSKYQEYVALFKLYKSMAPEGGDAEAAISSVVTWLHKDGPARESKPTPEQQARDFEDEVFTEVIEKVPPRLTSRTPEGARKELLDDPAMKRVMKLLDDLDKEQIDRAIRRP